jgi:hypothetical protein
MVSTFIKIPYHLRALACGDILMDFSDGLDVHDPDQ